MANTNTNTRPIINGNTVVQVFNCASDGSEETDLVIYDSSVVATALGISDPLDCAIKELWFYPSVTTTTRLFLEFDATTDVLAFALPSVGPVHVDFTTIMGGLANNAGTGITGDITLTTTGLEAGDKFTLILKVKPH